MGVLPAGCVGVEEEVDLAAADSTMRGRALIAGCAVEPWSAPSAHVLNAVLLQQLSQPVQQRWQGVLQPSLLWPLLLH